MAFKSDHEQQWFEAFIFFQRNVLNVADTLINANKRTCPDAIHGMQALDFMRRALFHLEQANKAGHHAVALSLLRQSVDPLFLIEAAVTSDGTARRLLAEWADQKSTIGTLRKTYSAELWSHSRNKFLGREWVDFLGEMYSSIQEYAHYNFSTLQWTMSYRSHSINPSDGHYRVAAKTWAYDAEQASRITLFQSLLLYIIYRSLLASSAVNGHIIGGFDEVARKYEEGLSKSKLIAIPFSWKNELLGLSFPITYN